MGKSLLLERRKRFIRYVVLERSGLHLIYSLKLAIENQLYVAKQFFNIGSGTTVSAQDNESFLTGRLIRLKTVDWFLNEFKHLRKPTWLIYPLVGILFMNVLYSHQDVYYADVLVSDAFLIRETGPRSVPFGLEPDNDDAAVWLVEPQRTTSVVKFGGTLVHPTRRDKLGITLSAFAHYVYGASHEELVLADIQGMLFPLTQHRRLTFQSQRLSHDRPRS